MTQYLELIREVVELKQAIEEMHVFRQKDARLIRLLLSRLNMQLPIPEPQNITEQAAMDWYKNYGMGDRYEELRTRFYSAAGTGNLAHKR